jgi:hypothetical protein
MDKELRKIALGKMEELKRADDKIRAKYKIIDDTCEGLVKIGVIPKNDRETCVADIKKLV